MIKEKDRIKQTVKLLKWARQYPGWWYLICTPNEEHMNPQMMKLLIERLAEKSFYELIFVLIMVHREKPFVDEFIKSMLLEMLISKWGEDNEEIIKQFIAYLE